MKRAFYPIFLAMLPLVAALATPPATCLGGETSATCCSDCASGGNSCGDSSCGCCSCWHTICNFRLVDGCTHYFWKRTWYGPNALATPLRQYYIPRSPSCWGVDSYAWKTHPANQEQFYMPSCMDCENLNAAPTTVVDHPSNGSSTAHLERLGQIRNELDVIGATTVRGAAPAH